MATYKNIMLDGTEQEVKLSGQNCDIRNDSVDTVYASTKTPISADGNGVLSIPAGQAAKLLDCAGTVYLLGTGTVALCGNDHAEQVFKCAPAGGGGGTVDTEARNAISSLAQSVSDNSDSIKSLTQTSTANSASINTLTQTVAGNTNDIESLSSSVSKNISSLEQAVSENTQGIEAVSLTTNQNSNDIVALQKEATTIKAIATAISNPNLADNPDFSVNQRGQTLYTTDKETSTKVRIFDRWYSWMSLGSTITLNDGYISLKGNDTIPQQDCRQLLDINKNLIGKKVTLSMCYRTAESINNSLFIRSVAADNTAVNIGTITFPLSEDWTIASVSAIIPEDAFRLEIGAWGTAWDCRYFKLEVGNVVTPFVPPEPATELLKCQRYYQLHTTGDIDPIDLRPSMRIIPSVLQKYDGTYAYYAEL